MCVHFQPKIVRVLNLWQKNDIYTPDIIQPLMALASQNSSKGGSSSNTSTLNHSQSHTSVAEPTFKNISADQSSSFNSGSSKTQVGSGGTKTVAELSESELIIKQQQDKIAELEQLIQAQALQNLLGQNPVLAAAAAAVAVKDKGDGSIVSLLQAQDQLNQLEMLKNQLAGQVEPLSAEPVVKSSYKEDLPSTGHTTEFNKVRVNLICMYQYKQKLIMNCYKTYLIAYTVY